MPHIDDFYGDMGDLPNPIPFRMPNGGQVFPHMAHPPAHLHTHPSNDYVHPPTFVWPNPDPDNLFATPLQHAHIMEAIENRLMRDEQMRMYEPDDKNTQFSVGQSAHAAPFSFQPGAHRVLHGHPGHDPHRHVVGGLRLGGPHHHEIHPRHNYHPNETLYNRMPTGPGLGFMRPEDSPWYNGPVPGGWQRAREHPAPRWSHM